MSRSEIHIRVIYADTDAMGIVYHTNYIKWFEMGRTELFRSMGISWSKMGLPRYFFPLTKVACHYLRPARYDDLVVVETELAEIKRASIFFTYRIYDEEKKELLVRGSSLHACTDESGSITRIPAVIKSRAGR